MKTSEREYLKQLERRLLRHPELVGDIDIDRTAIRLMAARSDTPQLLLHHALALEAQLQQIKRQLHELSTAPPSAANGSDTPVAGSGQPAVVPAVAGFVRDAAVVGTGLLGGSLLLHGIASAFSDSELDAADSADLDFGSDLLG